MRFAVFTSVVNRSFFADQRVFPPALLLALITSCSTRWNARDRMRKDDSTPSGFATMERRPRVLRTSDSRRIDFARNSFIPKPRAKPTCWHEYRAHISQMGTRDAHSNVCKMWTIQYETGRKARTTGLHSDRTSLKVKRNEK